MLDAKNIVFDELEDMPVDIKATGAGRGYACAGGVAGAIEKCIKEYYPETEVKIQHAEGLANCKKALTLAKAGMGCPGGCVAGVGTIIPPERAKLAVDKIVENADKKVPPREMEDLAKELAKMK